jgi:hypothetical protein
VTPASVKTGFEDEDSSIGGMVGSGWLDDGEGCSEVDS